MRQPASFSRWGKQTVVTNPPYPSHDAKESWTCRSTCLTPAFRILNTKNKRIPAYENQSSLSTSTADALADVLFCTISAHQESSLSGSKEKYSQKKAIAEIPDFSGYLSDLGGPSATCIKWVERYDSLPSLQTIRLCIHPKVCPEPEYDHQPLLEIYHGRQPFAGIIKKSFIGSGVRATCFCIRVKMQTNQSTKEYTRELITRHVSGRLKVAPEHTSDKVLYLMRKPPISNSSTSSSVSLTKSTKKRD